MKSHIENGNGLLIVDTPKLLHTHNVNYAI